MLILLFGGVNLLLGGVSDSTYRIDGEYFSTGERELTLCLMTEEGTESLTEFTRLETLKIIPYKYAAAESMELGDEAYDTGLHRKAEDVYSDCTDLEDLSFLAPLTALKSLDVSYCKVTDLSFAANMNVLESLDISHTEITDLSPLVEMDSLRELTVGEELSGDVTDRLTEKGVKVTFEK